MTESATIERRTGAFKGKGGLDLALHLAWR